VAEFFGSEILTPDFWLSAADFPLARLGPLRYPE
jgi:hypothetical protein